MLTKDHLLECADLFRTLTGVEEVTLSYRVFGDTKKLRQMRGAHGITLDRFNTAMRWFAANWPAEAAMPDRLMLFRETPTPQDKDAAA